MKINILLAAFSMTISSLWYCQVGIGTQNPNGVFNIDASSNNTTVTGTQFQDDITVISNGNVGVGTNNPAVKLDVRSNGSFNTIGLGCPTDIGLTASAAKTGAIKYYYDSSTDKGIKYSNGTNWIKRTVTDVKALVFARKSTTQSINANTTTNITEWIKDTDRTNSYNSDVFTAPRTGIYVASLNVAFQNNAIANDSTIEVILNSTSTLGVPQFRCVYSFPGTGTGTVSNVVSGSCTGVFNLSTGNTITPQVIQNIGGSSSRNILNDSSYNTLSISEL